MAKQHGSLNSNLRNFIERQQIFFVASSTQTSRVNVSPRETASLRIPGDNSAIYLDRTGSGNKTAAHVLADGRLTFMFCAFQDPPRILRLCGEGKSIGWKKPEFEQLISEHYGGAAPLGTRQIMRLDFDLMQTSCGNGVPLVEYQGERTAIDNWHKNKGPEGISAYWKEKNLHSIDGLPTGFQLEDY